MKTLLPGFVSALALGVGLGAISPAHAGGCGPGWGTGQVVGTVAGAAAGGVVGNQFGKGSGKDVATAAGVIVGGLLGNQAGESVDAANCAPPPPQPVMVVPAPPPAVVYQPAPPPAVIYQPAPPPPAFVYQPAPVYAAPPAYIVESQVTWGEVVYVSPGRDCRAYSEWAYVNGAMQPVYGVACRDYAGWRYERPYAGAWRVNVEFDRDRHYHGHHH